MSNISQISPKLGTITSVEYAPLSAPTQHVPGAPDADQLRHVQNALLAWFTTNGRDLPWRRTRDPYRVLVSEIMLQQTQVDRVKSKWEAFLAQFPTLDALAAAAPGDVIRAWAGLGYNRRALNLQRTAQAVLRDWHGQFPTTPQELKTLPGIGPYTAGAVACFAFERDVGFMDTNIKRVVQRVWVGPDDTPAPDRDLLQLAEQAVPAGHGWAWNQAVMELGALVCTAAKPRCQICPLRSACRAYRAWCAADEAVFSYQPTRPTKLAKVAERNTPFASTPRYFRGRIVDALRQQEPGTWLPLAALGEQVKSDWTSDDMPWLIQLVRGLAADGLAELDAAQQHARLP